MYIYRCIGAYIDVPRLTGQLDSLPKGYLDLLDFSLLEMLHVDVYAICSPSVSPSPSSPELYSLSPARLTFTQTPSYPGSHLQKNKQSNLTRQTGKNSSKQAEELVYHSWKRRWIAGGC